MHGHTFDAVYKKKLKLRWKILSTGMLPQTTYSTINFKTNCRAKYLFFFSARSSHVRMHIKLKHNVYENDKKKKTQPFEEKRPGTIDNTMHQWQHRVHGRFFIVTHQNDTDSRCALVADWSFQAGSGAHEVSLPNKEPHVHVTTRTLTRHKWNTNLEAKVTPRIALLSVKFDLKSITVFVNMLINTQVW